MRHFDLIHCTYFSQNEIMNGGVALTARIPDCTDERGDLRSAHLYIMSQSSLFKLLGKGLRARGIRLPPDSEQRALYGVVMLGDVVKGDGQKREDFALGESGVNELRTPSADMVEEKTVVNGSLGRVSCDGEKESEFKGAHKMVEADLDLPPGFGGLGAPVQKSVEVGSLEGRAAEPDGAFGGAQPDDIKGAVGVEAKEGVQRGKVNGEGSVQRAASVQVSEAMSLEEAKDEVNGGTGLPMQEKENGGQSGALRKRDNEDGGVGNDKAGAELGKGEVFGQLDGGRSRGEVGVRGGAGRAALEERSDLKERPNSGLENRLGVKKGEEMEGGSGKRAGTLAGHVSEAVKKVRGASGQNEEDPSRNKARIEELLRRQQERERQDRRDRNREERLAREREGERGRGLERRAERGLERNPERGSERRQERLSERGLERGSGKEFRQERRSGRSLERGLAGRSGTSLERHSEKRLDRGGEKRSERLPERRSETELEREDRERLRIAWRRAQEDADRGVDQRPHYLWITHIPKRLQRDERFIAKVTSAIPEMLKCTRARQLGFKGGIKVMGAIPHGVDKLRVRLGSMEQVARVLYLVEEVRLFPGFRVLKL